MGKKKPTKRQKSKKAKATGRAVAARKEGRKLGEYHPSRSIGRMNDRDWQLLKKAAAIEEKKFTTWASSILLEAASRVVKKAKK